MAIFSRDIKTNLIVHSEILSGGERATWLNEHHIPHNLHGPAVIDRYPDGSCKAVEWWVKGKHHRVDGPAIVKRLPGGRLTKMWKVNGRLHRTDGPAIERADGMVAWWVDGSLHRVDGPATIGPFGRMGWYVHDHQYTNTHEFQQAAGLTDAEMAALVLRYGPVE